MKGVKKGVKDQSLKVIVEKNQNFIEAIKKLNQSFDADLTQKSFNKNSIANNNWNHNEE